MAQSFRLIFHQRQNADNVLLLGNRIFPNFLIQRIHYAQNHLNGADFAFSLSRKDGPSLVMDANKSVEFKQFSLAFSQ